MGASSSEKRQRGELSHTVCRTVHQYSRGTVSDADMKKLQEVAEDYRRVKNLVYARYGGIAGLPKLYPGYTVQNEMTGSGIREEMGMPSVYFYLAVFDALGDIKSQWTRTRSKVLELIGRNERFTPEEKHYLRFLLKVSSALEAVLLKMPVRLPEEIQRKYEELAGQTDPEKLHRYLCRQVRKYQGKLHTEQALGFTASERAYRYGDHGIYLSVKEKRKRVFLPLTDSNQYKCQIYVKLYPEQGRVELDVPVYTAVRVHEDYTGRIGISMGFHTMLTTDSGNRYGEELGRYQMEFADWIREQTKSYRRNKNSNPGRKKYYAKKRCLTEQMNSCINHELNRFLETEKPGTIYIVRMPPPCAGGANSRINHSMTMWKRGYIRSRLIQKCREQSVELIEVVGKDISRECSRCGAPGSRRDGLFCCDACGCRMEEKTNTAKNVLRRGTEGKILSNDGTFRCW